MRCITLVRFPKPTGLSGVYEWESREAAQAFYDEAWFERLRTVYGTQPELQFFDLHALVDNEAQTARIDA